MAWFPFFLFDTDWMGREVYRGEPSSADPAAVVRYQAGVRDGALGLLLFAVVQAVTAFSLYPICIRFGPALVWATGNLLLAASLFSTWLVTAAADNAAAAAAAAASVAEAAAAAAAGANVTGAPAPAPGVGGAGGSFAVGDGVGWQEPSTALRAAALSVFALAGASFAITGVVPYSITADQTAGSGAGQGLSMGILNLAIVCPQVPTSFLHLRTPPPVLPCFPPHPVPPWPFLNAHHCSASPPIFPHPSLLACSPARLPARLTHAPAATCCCITHVSSTPHLFSHSQPSPARLIGNVPPFVHKSTPPTLRPPLSLHPSPPLPPSPHARSSLSRSRPLGCSLGDSLGCNVPAFVPGALFVMSAAMLAAARRDTPRGSSNVPSFVGDASSPFFPLSFPAPLHHPFSLHAPSTPLVPPSSIQILVSLGAGPWDALFGGGNILVSLGAGPWDALFGGGNVPAFVLGALFAVSAAVLSAARLSKLPRSTASTGLRRELPMH
ncbi:unnamed protein product [Closterium sp. NIES-54]